MTIREAAKLIGVSPATISIVLNGKEGVSDETRIRVRQELERVGYVHEPRGAKSTHSPTGNILVIKYFHNGSLVEENDGFITMIIDSMSERFKALGYSNDEGGAGEGSYGHRLFAA